MYGYNFSCGLRKTKTLKMAIGPTFCGMGEGLRWRIPLVNRHREAFQLASYIWC